MFKTQHVPKLQGTERSTYLDTESYAGEAEGGTDYGSQRGHDEDGHTLHATHGGNVANKHFGVCILCKQHTANWHRLQTTGHSIYTKEQTPPATRNAQNQNKLQHFYHLSHHLHVGDVKVQLLYSLHLVLRKQLVGQNY